MDLRSLLIVLRRRWRAIVITVGIGLLAAGAVSALTTPQFTATSRLFFSVQSGESVTDLAQGSSFTERQMASYAEVATSPLVLDQVITDLQLPMSSGQLARRIEATAPADTVILEIAVSDTDANRAALIANAVGDRLTAAAGQLSPPRADGSQSVRATLLARALPPGAASSPIVARNLALGAALGLIAGLALALLRQALDVHIRSEEDLALVSDAAVLGVIPMDRSQTTPLALLDDEDNSGSRSEAVRRLRTNLQFVEVDEQASSILVTSSLPGEGKTTTAISLARSMSDTGQRVILVDADLRRPQVASYLDLEGQVGLTTVLIGRTELGEVVQRWRQTTLDVLPAGRIPPNPSELLGSKAMQTLLAELTRTYDMVILDSPPVLPVSDAAVLSKFVGGTLLVVGADRIQRPQLRKTTEALDTVGAHVVGTVLNKIARRDAGAYGYGYGYGSYSRRPEAPVDKPATVVEPPAPVAVQSLDRPADEATSGSRR